MTMSHFRQCHYDNVTHSFLKDIMFLAFREIKHQTKKQIMEIPYMGKVSPLYLKLLIPHEVEGLFDLGNCTGAFPAEVGGGPPV